jgi:putative spermidine/putrescine transport system ATP-binding protein
MHAGGGGARFDAGGGGARFAELRMDRVSRSFAGRFALQDLELAIKGGEFVALLGPSGCGKSTALNCLAGLLPLSGGSIWLDDRRVDSLPPEKRGFGMVFQNYALFPHMSVRRNVGFGLSMRGVGRQDARRRVEEALRLVQLSQYADRLPGQLSGGQQQRVAIARALVNRPAILMCDEPTGNLDTRTSKEVIQLFRDLNDQDHITVILVTHDQDVAKVARRIVVLRDGEIVQDTPDLAQAMQALHAEEPADSDPGAQPAATE